MSGHVKMGLIIGGAIILATAMWIYFSPYQRCIRAFEDLWGDGTARYCVNVLKG